MTQLEKRRELRTQLKEIFVIYDKAIEDFLANQSPENKAYLEEVNKKYTKINNKFWETMEL